MENERLTLTKIHSKLARLGIETTYSGLYRFVSAEIGLPSRYTVRMAETEPGEVAEVDFGRLGLLYDPESEREEIRLRPRRHPRLQPPPVRGDLPYPKPSRSHLGYGGRVGILWRRYQKGRHR